jgi:hypothetical protein
MAGYPCCCETDPTLCGDLPLTLEADLTPGGSSGEPSCPCIGGEVLLTSTGINVAFCVTCKGRGEEGDSCCAWDYNEGCSRFIFVLERLEGGGWWQWAQWQYELFPGGGFIVTGEIAKKVGVLTFPIVMTAADYDCPPHAHLGLRPCGVGSSLSIDIP